MMHNQTKNRYPTYRFTLLIATGLLGCGGANDLSSGSSAGASSVGGTSSGGATNVGGSTSTSRGGSGARGGGGSGGVSVVGGATSSGGALGTGGTTGACTDPDASLPFPNKIASTIIGTNGSFSDHCDSSGNLVEYHCEATSCPIGPYPLGQPSIIAPNTYPMCTPQLTGQVLSTTVACGGKCNAGRCFQWCPYQGDTVSATSVGTSTVSMSFMGYALTCSVVFTQTGFNCLDKSIAGTTLAVVSEGNCDATTTVFGAALPNSSGAEACAYQCTVGN